jgi:hypothetical protein
MLLGMVGNQDMEQLQVLRVQVVDLVLLMVDWEVEVMAALYHLHPIVMYSNQPNTAVEGL